MTPLISMAWTLIDVAVLLLVVMSIKDNDDAAWAVIAFGWTGIIFLFLGLFL